MLYQGFSLCHFWRVSQSTTLFDIPSHLLEVADVFVILQRGNGYELPAAFSDFFSAGISSQARPHCQTLLEVV